MIETEDLEKIHVPWKLLIFVSLLATSIVFAFPLPEWVKYYLLQSKLQNIADKKVEELRLSSSFPEEWPPGIQRNGHVIRSSAPTPLIHYFLYEVCPSAECVRGYSPKLEPNIPEPAALTLDALQSWGNEVCRNIHVRNQSMLSAGAIIYRNSKPVALLCVVSFTDW